MLDVYDIEGNEVCVNLNHITHISHHKASPIQRVGEIDFDYTTIYLVNGLSVCTKEDYNHLRYRMIAYSNR